MGAVPPREKQAGPGYEPALCGPIRSTPSSIMAMEPPPAPMASMPVTGITTGKSPTSAAFDVMAWPSRSSEISVLVPPMSIVRMLRSPAARARYWTAVTPEAGPESSVCTGKRRASAAAMAPPLERVTNNCDPGSRPSTYRSTAPMYSFMRFRTNALSTLTIARSYSPTRGQISLERLTSASAPTTVRMASSTARSCAGLA